MGCDRGWDPGVCVKVLHAKRLEDGEHTLRRARVREPLQQNNAPAGFQGDGAKDRVSKD